MKSEDPADIEQVRGLELSVAEASVDGATLFKFTRRSVLPGSVEITAECVFSEAGEFAPISETYSRFPEATVMQRHDWTYTKFDGVIIPQTHRRRLFDEDGWNTRFDRTYTLADARLNKEIDPNTFSVHNLGLEEGDDFVDRVTKTRSVYHASGLIQPTGPSVIARLIGAFTWSLPIAGLAALAIAIRHRRARATGMST